MSRLVLLAALLVTAGTAMAERPVRSCGKAPRLMDVHERLPDHVLADAADVEPAPVEKLPVFPRGIWMRSGNPLTCVVVVLDEGGVPQDAVVSYPSGFALTDRGKAGDPFRPMDTGAGGRRSTALPGIHGF